MNMPLVSMNRRRRGGAAAFTPAGLFALAEPGVWYDPSDLTTLFQDTAGTLPVTTPGQTVARINDKSGRGNNATQATLASRPTYGIVPLGGRRNLLTRTEEFGDAAWSNFGLAAFGSGSVVNAIAAPDGTVTADLLTENSSTSTHVSTRSDGNFTGTAKTFSVHAKANGRRYIGVAAVASDVGQIGVFDLQAGTYIGAVNGPSGGTGVNVVAASIEDKGNGWYRCSVSFDVASASRFPVLYLMNGTASANASYAGNGASGVYLWGAQLETGSSATAYQRVGSAFDVTEAGVASLSYLSFDGVDDWLVTPTITPGIDKAQAFAGVRKLSDAAVGVVAELSAAAGTNRGAFVLLAPASTGSSGNFGFYSTGSLVVGSSAVSATLLAPFSAVLTGVGDISGDLSSMRTNGVVGTNATDNQGTGNYLAYPLYIGRRGGTTLPFNGQLYSLTVRFGANLDSTSISSMETWVAGKTGVTL